MLLPPELLTLVFLAGLTAVHAQVDDTPTPTYTPTPAVSLGVTTPTVASPASPTGEPNDIDAPAPTPTTDEPLPTDDIYPCDLPDPPDWCSPPDFWHPEETATGWESDDWASWNDGGFGGGNNLAPPTPTSRPVEQTPDVITIVTPTVVGIATSVEPGAEGGVGAGTTVRPWVSSTVSAGDGQPGLQEPSAQISSGLEKPQTTVAGVQPKPAPAPAPAPAPGQSTARPNPTPAPGQSTAGSKPHAGDAPALGQSATTGNALLDTIINHLGKAQPGAQPAQPAQPTQPVLRTTAASGEQFIQESAASPTEPARVPPSGSAQAREAVSDSITLGNTITLGSATIHLTPGLSTMIGTGTHPTLIAIQTDSASRTLITISSSGTAITATITHAPATVTLPRTGSTASTTQSAGRGVATSRVGVTAVTTTSKGAAAEGRVRFSGLSGFVLGVLAIL